MNEEQRTLELRLIQIELAIKMLATGIDACARPDGSPGVGEIIARALQELRDKLATDSPHGPAAAGAFTLLAMLTPHPEPEGGATAQSGS